MLPDREIDLLTNAAAAAMFLAGEGHLAAGYELLVEGKKRAEELRDRGARFGEALAER